jgi:hypothetical protein
MGDDNKYAGDKSGGGPGLTPENKYAGDAPEADAELTADNKYAGEPTPGTDSGATTDSSSEPTSDPDSGISPANKYAG